MKRSHRRLREVPTTQRRLQFAHWVTDPRNPLTARVFVNRLWLGHFGEGIVRTPNNFGFKGALPTHPQLLDWLAAEFVDGGWSIKRMHRLILTSATYRQASIHPRQAEYAGIDSANERWWRFDRRRLDAEAIRDAMLTVSGRLNPQLHGPSFFPAMSDEALEGLSRKEAAWTTSTDEERSRRSIYMMTKRSRLLPLMTVFNFTDTTLPCGQRDVTTEPTQALALLNNEFVHEQSEALATRDRIGSGRRSAAADRACLAARIRPASLRRRARSSPATTCYLKPTTSRRPGDVSTPIRRSPPPSILRLRRCAMCCSTPTNSCTSTEDSPTCLDTSPAAKHGATPF